MTDDDATLVRRCLDGVPEAMRELITQFQTDVFGMCVRMLNHRQDAEDVVQETFVRVFRSLRRWDSTRPLRPWIMRIAFNRCKTWLGKRIQRPDSVDYLHDLPAREEADDSTELQAELRDALQTLRPEYRSVFVLYHEQGRPYEEIAEAVGRPVGTIKTWLHRARLELLTYLRQRGMVPASSPHPEQ